MPNNMDKVRRMVQEQFPEKSDEEVERIVEELYALAEIIYEVWQSEKKEPRIKEPRGVTDKNLTAYNFRCVLIF